MTTELSPVSARAVLLELEDASTAVRRKIAILEHFRDVFSSSGLPSAAVDRNAAVPSLCRVSAAVSVACMTESVACASFGVSKKKINTDIVKHLIRDNGGQCVR